MLIEGDSWIGFGDPDRMCQNGEGDQDVPASSQPIRLDRVPRDELVRIRRSMRRNNPRTELAKTRHNGAKYAVRI